MSSAHCALEIKWWESLWVVDGSQKQEHIVSFSRGG